MRDGSIVHFKLGDSPDEVAAAKPYMGIARTQLGILNNLMRLGNLQQGARSITLEDGTVIQARSIYGQHLVGITPSLAAVQQVVRAQHAQQAQPEEETPPVVPAGPARVFIVGYTGALSGDSRAAMWVDGVYEELQNGDNYSQALQVSQDGTEQYGFVFTDDFYLATWDDSGLHVAEADFPLGVSKDGSVWLVSNDSGYGFYVDDGARQSLPNMYGTRTVTVAWQAAQQNVDPGTGTAYPIHGLLAVLVEDDAGGYSEIAVYPNTGHYETGFDLDYWRTYALAGQPIFTATIGVEFDPVEISNNGTGSAYTVTLNAHVRIEVDASGSAVVIGTQVLEGTLGAEISIGTGVPPSPGATVVSPDGLKIVGSRSVLTGFALSGVGNSIDYVASDSESFILNPRTLALTFVTPAYGTVRGVSDNGIVTGDTGSPNYFGFVQSTGAATTFPLAVYSAGYAITPDGSKVVGEYLTGGSSSPASNYHAYLWTPASGTFTDLERIGEGENLATAVSDDGSVIAGIADFGAAYDVVVWKDGIPSIIGTDGYPLALSVIS